MAEPAGSNLLATLPPALPHIMRQCARWLAPRKVPAAALVAAALALGLLITAGAKMSAQAPLFDAPLHSSQAMEVERALLVWNEPFSPDATHTQLFVPVSRRREVLLRLTIAGLPHRYVPTTEDVLEQPTSAFAPLGQAQDRRRSGIEGDLVVSLRRMNGVADASVVIAPAVSDPLGVSDDGAPASASVQLLMQPGARLDQNQVAGIKRFVAASYPGLEPERVVVIDAFGAAASGSPEPDGLAARESRLQSSIQGALDSVYGAGTTVVRVSARAADEERSTQRTLIAPHGLLESERGSESGIENGRKLQRERSHTRYAYDTTVETQTVKAGALARLSVAVFVDAHVVAVSQASSIRDLVRAAAGADLESGDQVVVAAVPFHARAVYAAPHSSGMLRRAAVVTCMLLVMAACATPFAKRWLHRPTIDDIAACEVKQALVDELPQTAAYVLSGLPARVRRRVLAAYDVKLRDEIAGYINARSRS